MPGRQCRQITRVRISLNHESQTYREIIPTRLIRCCIVARLATLTFQNMLHLSQVLMVESTKAPSPADEL